METTQHSLRHLAIIMDGNGRWAKARGLPRVLGHREGAAAVRRIVEASCELGIKALTLYAFSWENRDRPADEIQELMWLLDEFLRRETPTLLSQQIRLRAIGRLEALPRPVLEHLREVMERTQSLDRMTLTLALSYGGRQEIVDAARRLAEEVRQGTLQPQEIDEARFIGALYAPDLPDPDLVIRTSGEQRLSNFLLWQSSYTELYVTPKFWPEFSKVDLVDAIAEFERRERRFGRVGDEAAMNGQARA
jgi:undecaprenyl diphosphate synthase